MSIDSELPQLYSSNILVTPNPFCSHGVRLQAREQHALGFTGGPDPLMGIIGSIAFDCANAKSNIISGVDEEIHTANERRLGEIISKNASKLHTGRSHNEQAIYGMRMWLRDELRKIDDRPVSFLKLIAARAESETEYIMPGYTHIQRAQPVRWSHWMLSYGLAFASDLERLRETIKRINRSPLGFWLLGFAGLLWNSMGGVADRDFFTKFLQWGSILMQHISRWAEDPIYSAAELGFIRLADAYSTGSSLMPQKKNAHSLEADRCAQEDSCLRGRCMNYGFHGCDDGLRRPG
ncbi:hypothetical protein FSARC_12201 [Fusarium sarcochroum]|uniref:Arginosuccinase n=1 Tax=Fusarium sarcochroum TaxID=1208366 RepID=A0A8H4TAH3_9HYPO|nr:hypothetical protein FSARC_12201 [Fusarium sarcochroum]